MSALECIHTRRSNHDLWSKQRKDRARTILHDQKNHVDCLSRQKMTHHNVHSFPLPLSRMRTASLPCPVDVSNHSKPTHRKSETQRLSETEREKPTQFNHDSSGQSMISSWLPAPPGSSQAPKPAKDKVWSGPPSSRSRLLIGGVSVCIQYVKAQCCLPLRKSEAKRPG